MLLEYLSGKIAGVSSRLCCARVLCAVRGAARRRRGRSTRELLKEMSPAHPIQRDQLNLMRRTASRFRQMRAEIENLRRGKIRSGRWTRSTSNEIWRERQCSRGLLTLYQLLWSEAPFSKTKGGWRLCTHVSLAERKGRQHVSLPLTPAKQAAKLY